MRVAAVIGLRTGRARRPVVVTGSFFPATRLVGTGWFSLSSSGSSWKVTFFFEGAGAFETVISVGSLDPISDSILFRVCLTGFLGSSAASEVSTTAFLGRPRALGGALVALCANSLAAFLVRGFGADSGLEEAAAFVVVFLALVVLSGTVISAGAFSVSATVGVARGVTLTRLRGAAVMVAVLLVAFATDLFDGFSTASSIVASVVFAAFSLRTPADFEASAFLNDSFGSMEDDFAARARVTRFAGEVGAMTGRCDGVI